MLKDLFNEMLRRMQWAKDRRLEPQLTKTSFEYACSIPLDDKVFYVVSVKDMKNSGILIQSLFPDGEPHYHVKTIEMSFDEAGSLINAALLIVYGRLMTPA
jgi:hypothetical protein